MYLSRSVARNVLLLAMVTDNELSDELLSKIWNSFFHFFLDEESLSFLIAQCQTLVEVSDSITAWNDSKYSKFIQMCNANTLFELRRHWELYVQAGQLSPAGKKQSREMVFSGIRTIEATYRKGASLIPPHSCHSAGPYLLQSAEPASHVSRHFWGTGTTSLNPRDVLAATLVNPTFFYSLAGEGFALHHDTTPISPFHLAPAFSNSEKDTPTMAELFDCAKSQFSSWVKRFRTFVQDKPGKLTIRLFAGDALFLCRALVHHVGTGKFPSNLTVAPWNLTPLVLDGGDCGGAPTSFNVIEASNIMDHIGLLNILIAAVPLLSPNPSATLFTGALLYAREGVAKHITTEVCADVSTMSLLLDLIPVNYLSNFNTRSNTEEIMATKFNVRFRPYHERVAWKRPKTGDSMITSQPRYPLRIPISFEPQNLCNLLFDIYLEMFASDENMERPFHLLQDLYDTETMHYTRETFAALLALVKARVNVDWDSTMASFSDRLDNDRTLPMGLANYYDFCTQLHLAGVYTVEFMRTPVRKEGRFRGWTRVPLTVSITLVVPRSELRVLLDVDLKKVAIPAFRGKLLGEDQFGQTRSLFTSVRVGFGKLTPSGTDACPGVVFEPDPSSWAGTSPLIVAFSVPSGMLHAKDPGGTAVALSLSSTPKSTPKFGLKQGTSITVFTVPLMDRSQVFVVPDEPRGLDESFDKVFANADHPEDSVSVTTDHQSRRATTFTARVNITHPPTKDILSSGVEVSSRQVSSCVMEVRIGQTRNHLVYPLPVVGSRSKLRIARKSSYVEVCRLYPRTLDSTSQCTV